MPSPSSAPRSASRPALEHGAAQPAIEISWRVAAVVYLVLATIYFLPAFMPGKQIFGTDYLAGAYPSYDFIVRQLAAGDLPKWVPHLFGGLPNHASPGSTYHPAVLIGSQFLATERVFALMFLVHFWLGCLGMYALARELGCRSWVAFVSGLAFGFTGLIASWVYAGHDGRVIAASMFPFVFFFIRRGVRTGAVSPFIGSAASIGLALLSFQIQVVYYLLLSAGLWGVYCLVRYSRSAFGAARTAALGLGSVALAFSLAAVILVPFSGYVPDSPRGQEGGRGYEYSTSYSMPPAELLAMAVPEQAGASVSDPTTGDPLLPEYSRPGGFKLHTEYVGAWVVLMLVVGAAVMRRERDWQFLAGLSVFGLTLAFGGFTPLYRIYYAALPGLDKFRAPGLAFCIVSFATVAMAAITLEHLAARMEPAARPRPKPRAAGAEDGTMGTVVWLIMGVAALAVLGALVTSVGEPRGAGPGRGAGWMRFALFAGMTGAALIAWFRGAIVARTAAVILALVVTADLWVIDRKFFHTYPPPGVVFGSDDVVDFLRAQPGPFRVWTLPVPQAYRGGGAYGSNYLMSQGIDQVGGEHPNPLQRWSELLGEGTRTYIDWHRVLVNPAVVEGPAGQAITFQSTPGFLEAANVRYIISMAPLNIPGLREVHRGSALVYENTRALGRAYLAASAVPAPGGALPAMASGSWNPQAVAYVEPGTRISLPASPLQGSADVVEYTPDRIVVTTRANRAALLVLADNYYKGWRATVDGREAEVVRTNHVFRGVAVPAGEHRVVFTFAPADLRTGALISLATLVLLGAAALASGVAHRRHTRAARTGPADAAVPSPRA